MNRIKIRTRCGEWSAVLDGSDLSNEIWLSLPYTAVINMFGSMLYFEMKLDAEDDGDSTVFEKGDIAYWPKADALCIFFGPTPLSTDDRPVTPHPMKKIGYVEGECSDMVSSGDRMKITMERSF